MHIFLHINLASYSWPACISCVTQHSLVEVSHSLLSSTGKLSMDVLTITIAVASCCINWKFTNMLWLNVVKTVKLVPCDFKYYREFRSPRNAIFLRNTNKVEKGESERKELSTNTYVLPNKLLLVYFIFQGQIWTIYCVTLLLLCASAIW